MIDQPLISVLLPVYNAERFLRPAIESILNQTYEHFELIIVNDCSQDASLHIANEYARQDNRVIVASNPENLKLSKTLNYAIQMSKGKYLARMDADDISAPSRLEKQVGEMEKNVDIVVVGCDINIINEDSHVLGSRKYYASDSEIREKIFYFSPFCHPAIMIRRDALEKAGGYDHYYNPAEDYELYFRLGAVGRFMNIKEFLFTYRIVTNSMTHSGTLNMEKKTIEIREKYKHHQGYRMPFPAKVYNAIHKLSLRVVSPSVRVNLYNFLRKKISD